MYIYIILKFIEMITYTNNLYHSIVYVIVWGNLWRYFPRCNTRIVSYTFSTKYVQFTGFICYYLIHFNEY